MKRLIAPERRGTARLYSDRDRARVTWILRGKRVGFSLAEIKEMLDLYDIGDSQQTQLRVTAERCKHRIDALRRQKDDIDATIAELEVFVETLADTRQPKDQLMPIYSAPVRETRFILDQVLDIGRYSNLPGFANASPDIIEAILEEAGKFCEEVLQPLNKVGDEVGCKRADDGSVTAPPGFKEAYRQWCEAGWPTLTAPEEYGGQGLPQVIGTAIGEYVLSANHSFEMYQGLTSGAIASLLVKASDELKQRYVPNMVTGKWTGTMNLTEPHCGTDLGLLKTRAEPNDDGSYAITGTKIFISSGEHDLSENIIHLVLAKRAGAPDNVKGISLFVVPEIPGQRRRIAGRSQQPVLRRARKEDGHSRQCDLRHEL